MIPKTRRGEIFLRRSVLHKTWDMNSIVIAPLPQVAKSSKYMALILIEVILRNERN